MDDTQKKGPRMGSLFCVSVTQDRTPWGQLERIRLD